MDINSKKKSNMQVEQATNESSPVDGGDTYAGIKGGYVGAETGPELGFGYDDGKNPSIKKLAIDSVQTAFTHENTNEGDGDVNYKGTASTDRSGLPTLGRAGQPQTGMTDTAGGTPDYSGDAPDEVDNEGDKLSDNELPQTQFTKAPNGGGAPYFKPAGSGARSKPGNAF